MPTEISRRKLADISSLEAKIALVDLEWSTMNTMNHNVYYGASEYFAAFPPACRQAGFMAIHTLL